jgi:hypothetical protein
VRAVRLSPGAAAVLPWDGVPGSPHTCELEALPAPLPATSLGAGVGGDEEDQGSAGETLFVVLSELVSGVGCPLPARFGLAEPDAQSVTCAGLASALIEAQGGGGDGPTWGAPVLVSTPEQHLSFMTRTVQDDEWLRMHFSAISSSSIKITALHLPLTSVGVASIIFRTRELPLNGGAVITTLGVTPNVAENDYDVSPVNSQFSSRAEVPGGGLIIAAGQSIVLEIEGARLGCVRDFRVSGGPILEEGDTFYSDSSLRLYVMRGEFDIDISCPMRIEYVHGGFITTFVAIFGGFLKCFWVFFVVFWFF